ncbi:stage II sporulation protein M [Sporolactobacillus inulinus]|uniref:Stage II sporulation protein M n=1 Tax=Sporolactobacillus inulinus CASD TaxID=1069536 RepID=A0A0U1QQA2_9BACL|nr:stage II sporulation protein M [Sporolactobacillus inulinus]KLI02981.1 stage II sporulation protein M [Sporolactobacillus inulinus CASD]GEB77132.1 stage II sporulation protein M [Sporolactobacillus inulinus]
MFSQRIKIALKQHISDYLSLYTFVTGLILMGIIFGAIVVNCLSYESKSNLLHYLQQFFGELAQHQIAEPQALFKESFLHHFQLILLIWVLGLSIIGLPVIFLLVFIKGMFLGFTVGFLISQMGSKGLMAVLVSIFPQNLIILPNFLFIAVLSVAFSLKMIRQLLMRTRKHPLLPQFINYAIVLAAVCFVAVIASGYESYLSPALIRIFIS